MKNEKSKFTKITRGLTAVVLILSFALTGCGTGADNTGTASGDSDTAAASNSDESGELTTVRLGVMTGNIDSWYATIGQQTGIYEEYGLNVEITEFAAGINTVDAITTDQIDVGFTADFAGINRLGNTAEQTNLRYFASIYASSESVFYVNPEKISDISDLKGKNIITLLGTVWEYMNARTVEKAGYTSNDISYQAVDSSQNALAVAKAGDGDAFWASGEAASRLAEYGWTPLLEMEDVGIKTYALYMATENYLEENEDTVVQFLKATQAAIDYIVENEDEAADIIYEATGLEQSVFKKEVEARDTELDVNQDVYNDLAEVAEWTYANGFYDTAININDFINTDALAKAFPEKVSWTAE